MAFLPVCEIRNIAVFEIPTKKEPGCVKNIR